MNGKGDSPRPYSVPISTYHENYDRIFQRPSSGSVVTVPGDSRKDG